MARLESMEPIASDPSSTLLVEEKALVTTRSPVDRKRKRPEDSMLSDTDWLLLEQELGDFFPSGKSAATEVMSFLQRPQSTNDDDKELKMFVVLPPTNDKEQRRLIHDWIRVKLEFCARADTVVEDNDKRIRIWHSSFEKEMPNFQAFVATTKTRRPSSTQHKYLQFVLYKENMDTGYAIQQLQRRYGKQRNLRMGFAGNKDKRGVTTQFVTVPATTPIASLASWNKQRPSSGGGGNTTMAGESLFRVGNFQYVADEIRLGRLQGNHFEVVLRNVQVEGASTEETKALLARAFNAIRQNGFINYFGTQRFGKFHDTHLTGIAVIKGDFEKAIEIIMEVKSGEREEITKARKKWQGRFENDLNKREEAEKMAATHLSREFRRGMISESAILQCLSRYPLQYKRAFSCIPKTLRMMFVHAFQSFLWNSVASLRMSNENGNNVQLGDLVMLSGIDGEPRELPPVKVVDADDLSSGKFFIEDVVLPLVGAKVLYPDNEYGDMYDRLLEDHGLSREAMANVTDRDLNCAGDYRKLICRPSDVDYKIMEYCEPLQPLLQTDLMRLLDIKIETKIDVGRETLLAAIVSYSLPSSSYATIFMRELMKRPTSSEFQSLVDLESTKRKCQETM